jgi:MOSC domain-containing protein YiiM
VTTGIDLPSLVGAWFTVGDALLFGMKRCPPCTHLERLTGVRLVKAMVQRGGINAAVFAGGPIAENDVVRPVPEAEAARRGAPTGRDRPVPRAV